MLELVQVNARELDKNEEISTINTAHAKSYVQTSQCSTFTLMQRCAQQKVLHSNTWYTPQYETDESRQVIPRQLPKLA